MQLHSHLLKQWELNIAFSPWPFLPKIPAYCVCQTSRTFLHCSQSSTLQNVETSSRLAAAVWQRSKGLRDKFSFSVSSKSTPLRCVKNVKRVEKFPVNFFYSGTHCLKPECAQTTTILDKSYAWSEQVPLYPCFLNWRVRIVAPKIINYVVG